MRGTDRRPRASTLILALLLAYLALAAIIIQAVKKDPQPGNKLEEVER